MLEEPYVVRELVSALSDAAKSIHYDGINLTGIGLAAYIVRGLKTHLGADLLVEFNALGMVAVEELKEGSLCACSTLASQELKA